MKILFKTFQSFHIYFFSNTSRQGCVHSWMFIFAKVVINLHTYPVLGNHMYLNAKNKDTFNMDKIHRLYFL